eukprot:2658577-Pleurochrysis_carterae.AAC.1
MAERGGVPLRRLAKGMRSHLAAETADRAYPVIQCTCADCSVGQETNFLRARAHQIRSAHQQIRLWQASRLAIDAHSTVSVAPYYHVAGAFSPGKELASDTFWERGHELPSFKVDNDSAVDFLLAVLDSPVGTLLTSQQLDRVNARAFGYAAMPAVCTALAYLHCNERVPQPSEKTLKRLA